MRFGLGEPAGMRLMVGWLIPGLVGLSSSAMAATFIVQPGTTTIQTAINQASAGDSIVLSPGTYNLHGGIVMKGGVSR